MRAASRAGAALPRALQLEGPRQRTDCRAPPPPLTHSLHPGGRPSGLARCTIAYERCGADAPRAADGALLPLARVQHVVYP